MVQLYDRFGFPAGVRPPPLPREIDLELSRLLKWKAMLESDRPPSMAKVRSRARKGIPCAIRGIAWTFLVAKSTLAPVWEGALEDSCNDDASLHAIMLDLGRTFPTHAIFGTASGQESLRRLLVRYATFDPGVGYCQGMSFLVGFLLTFATPQQAFSILTAVMNSPPWSFRALVVPGMPAVPLRLYQLDRLLAKCKPRLHAFLTKNELHMSHFATGWLISGLTTAFPFAFVARVWDIFLADGGGWTVMLSAIVAFLSVNERELLTCSFESFFTTMRTLPIHMNVELTTKELIRILDRYASGSTLTKFEQDYAKDKP